MTTRCSDCGALDAPWSAGHRRDCTQFRPAKTARICPVCDRVMRVSDVRIRTREHPAAAVFTCARCPGVQWTEVVDDRAGDDEEDARGAVGVEEKKVLPLAPLTPGAAKSPAGRGSRVGRYLWCWGAES